MSNGHRKFLEDLFSHYSKGETDKFFSCFDSKVKWTIHGEHDLAGEYKSLEDVKKTYKRYVELLRDKPKHRLRYLVIEGDKAIALLLDESVGKDNKNYNIHYALSLEFSKDGKKIVKVDNFVDSLPLAILTKAVSKGRMVA